jgi:hypothetical protein
MVFGLLHHGANGFILITMNREVKKAVRKMFGMNKVGMHARVYLIWQWKTANEKG